MPPKKNQKKGQKQAISNKNNTDYDPVNKQNKDDMNSCDDWNPLNIFGKILE